MKGNQKLTLSTAPHFLGRQSIRRDMVLVTLALAFPTGGAIAFFGLRVVWMLATGIIASLLTEWCAKKLRRKPFFMDGSALVTGILLVLVLPPTVPLWMIALGAVFSIGIVKEAFGGLGANIFNPALAGRAFLTVSFAGAMTHWVAPLSTTASAVTTATPLADGFVWTASTSALYKALFLGSVGGSIGETSALLILVGGAMLLAFRVIRWHVPFIYIGTVFIGSWVLGHDPMIQILAGGLMLGAFFMATDYVTSPLTTKGRVVFAVGAGTLTVLIRSFASMPGGVNYSILLMNALTPLIDRYTRTRPLGIPRRQGKKVA